MQLGAVLRQSASRSCGTEALLIERQPSAKPPVTTFGSRARWMQAHTKHA
jgi:hypothetical protein